MLARCTERLGRGEVLTSAEISEVVQALVREEWSAEEKASFLMALAQRGETPEEIAAFARELRALAVAPLLSPALRSREILDVVGTGGDRLNTFNISTTAALLASAAGVTVAKHGNRAVTSKSGSADLLEALGIRLELQPEEVGPWLEEHRFAFLFAPRFHPAFRHIAPARKLCAAAGRRTLFNILGPLLNPVVPTAELMGVARPDLAEPLARVLQSLGIRRGMVVCGRVPAPADGGESGDLLVDELSTLGPSRVVEFYQEHALSQSDLDPSLFPVTAARLEDLRGGDPAENAATTRAILGGKDRGPKREAVLLNAGAALFVAGAAGSIGAGWERAAEVIESGAALRHLETLVAASRR